MDLPPGLVGLARHQAGLLTTRQLREAGVTREALRWNVGRRWQVILPSVVALERGTPTQEQRLVAAQLHAGPDAVVAGASAARLHGVGSADDRGLVRVLVPRPRRSRRTWFADIRATRLEDPDAVRRGPLTLSCPARAVVDAAAACPTDDEASAVVIEALQRGIARLEGVSHWLGRLGRRDSARARRAVATAATGAWSVPEADLLALMGSSSSLPAPWANPHLTDADGVRLTTPDAWLDDVALAVMVHSHAHHAIGPEWDATVDRDGDLTAAGVIVLGVTPGRLARSPGLVLDRIERTYATARQRPRPPVTAVPRHQTLLSAGA